MTGVANSTQSVPTTTRMLRIVFQDPLVPVSCHLLDLLSECDDSQSFAVQAIDNDLHVLISNRDVDDFDRWQMNVCQSINEYDSGIKFTTLTE